MKTKIEFTTTGRFGIDDTNKYNGFFSKTASLAKEGVFSDDKNAFGGRSGDFYPALLQTCGGGGGSK